MAYGMVLGLAYLRLPAVALMAGYANLVEETMQALYDCRYLLR